MSNKKHNPINSPIWNPINNPKFQLKAKEAKERSIFGCTLAEFIVLSLQEQQRRLPGFTELSAMTKVVSDARSASLVLDGGDFLYLPGAPTAIAWRLRSMAFPRSRSGVPVSSAVSDK
jgi:hypothetical protein